MSADRWLCMGCESLNDRAHGECLICGMPFSESEQLRLDKLRREAIISRTAAPPPVRSALTEKPIRTLTPDAAPPELPPARPAAPRLPTARPTPPGFFPPSRREAASRRSSLKAIISWGFIREERREIARHLVMFSAAASLVLLPALLLIVWSAISGADTSAQITAGLAGIGWGVFFGYRLSESRRRRALLRAIRRTAIYGAALGAAVIVSGTGSTLLVRAYDLASPPTIFPMSFVLASIGLCGGVMLYALSKGMREDRLLQFFVEVMRLAFLLGIGAGVVLWFAGVITEVLVSMELGNVLRLWMATSGLTPLEHTASLLRAFVAVGLLLIIAAVGLGRGGTAVRTSTLAGVFGVVIGTLFSLLLPLTQTLHEIAAIAVWSATAGGAISLLNENI